MKWRPIILGLPKYLVACWSPWWVQLVMTVSCAGLLPARYHRFDPALSGHFLMSQNLLWGSFAGFHVCFLISKIKGGNLNEKWATPPFWCKGQPRRTRVAWQRGRKLAVHLLCMCLCRSRSSVIWCHSHSCVAAFKKKQFLGICFSPSSSGNHYSNLNTLRDLPELVHLSFVHPPLVLSNIFKCRRYFCR